MLARTEANRWRPTLDDPPMDHRISANEQMKVQAPKQLSPPIVSYANYYEEFDRKKVDWGVLQSTCVVSASLILLILCLFPAGSSAFKINHKQHLIVQSFEMAENFVLFVSATSFFISFFQLLMIFKLLKTHHPDTRYALNYIEKTSFSRNIVQVFWLLALLIYIIALFATYVTDTTKSHASRGFAGVFGIFAMIFCLVFVLKTMRYWFIANSQRKLQPHCNSQLSTLV